MEYQKLGNSGLKISKIIVGCMSYGIKAWEPWVIEDEEKVLSILKKCYDEGLRTYDTADIYSNGKSEELLGKFIKKFNIPREKIVILSKCFCPILKEDGSFYESLSVMTGGNSVNSNLFGLSRKHIFDAAEASVRRLGTYMDVLQIHRLDDTPHEEIMRALNDVVEKGYTRYIGASTMRAVDFVSLQYVAEKNGWHKFISMQNFYNLLYREEEREMNYFCNKTGVSLIPWSPNARGLLTRPANATTNRGEIEAGMLAHLGLSMSESNIEIINRVEELSKKHGVSMAAISVAWVLSKGACPIVGISSENRVDDLITALKVKLSEEEIKYLEEPYKPVTPSAI